MFKWIDGKILPILLQVYKVLAIAANSIQYVISILEQLQVPADKPVWDILRTIQNALNVGKDAVSKAIGFLGGEIPSVSSLADANLKYEVDTLKRML